MKKVLILSGAGLSAESGVRTFRDCDGMWEEYDVMEVCSVQGFAANRTKVLDFYDKRRADIEFKQPNRAHFMVAELQNIYGDKQVKVLTQNVDDLLEKAGCEVVVHLHGKLKEVRCETCNSIFDIGYSTIDTVGECSKCGSGRIRHNVVMFGEMAPAYETLYSELQQCEFLVVIGTSGQVLPVANYAHMVPESILNNLEYTVDIPHGSFTHEFYMPATAAAAGIEKLIHEYFTKKL